MTIFRQKFEMQQSLEITRSTRKVLAGFLDEYSVDQLNEIPHGFSNNLIWNIAHIVVVQQMLVYKLSGLRMIVSDEMVEKYKRGTRPDGIVSPDEIAEIRSLLFSTVEKAESDAASGIFENYQQFTSMSGFTIKSAADAMAFNNFHEGTHLGIMMSIRRFL